jgi:hypothetical protein
MGDAIANQIAEDLRTGVPSDPKPIDTKAPVVTPAPVADPAAPATSGGSIADQVHESLNPGGKSIAD